MNRAVKREFYVDEEALCTIREREHGSPVCYVNHSPHRKSEDYREETARVRQEAFDTTRLFRYAGEMYQLLAKLAPDLEEGPRTEVQSLLACVDAKHD